MPHSAPAAVPPLLRPLLVWVAATAVAALLAWALLSDLAAAAGAPAAPGEVAGAVTGLCEVLLLGCTAWAWAATTAVVVPVLRGRPVRRLRGVPHAWRRVVLLACSGALTVGVALPAHAVGGEAAAAGDRPTAAQVAASLLPEPPALAELPAPRIDGLPLPRRPVSAGVVTAPVVHVATAPATTSAAPRRVVVRPGDTLWAIAAADLGPAARDTDVAQHCRDLHRLNLAAVGPDPDLVLPGQRLDLP